MRRPEAAGALASLARIARQYEPGLGTRKFALLQRLSRGTLASARQVLRLHELLCFLDAYPDDRRVRGLARRMLADFRRRTDLRKLRGELTGTGIAGTDTPYRFYWPTAHWISVRWPGALTIDREDPEHARAILDAMPSLLEPVQAEFLRKHDAPTLAVFDRLRPRGVTDADFLIGLVAAMPGNDFTREAFFDRLDPPFNLRPGKDTPERTTARFDRLTVHYRREPFDRVRPLLAAEARRKPRRIIQLGDREAASLIQLARASMATRERDLEVFQFANPADAFLVDDGYGLAFAMLGMRPERRAVLPAIYGGLTLQNGVPVGYVQVDVLGRHAELSFNTFDTFRGADSAHVFRAIRLDRASRFRLRQLQRRAVPAWRRQRGRHRVGGLVVLPSLRFSPARRGGPPSRGARASANCTESTSSKFAAHTACAGEVASVLLTRPGATRGFASRPGTARGRRPRTQPISARRGFRSTHCSCSTGIASP